MHDLKWVADLLVKRGYVKARMEFSGGNDEGHADACYLEDEAGNRTELNDRWGSHYVSGEKGGYTTVSYPVGPLELEDMGITEALWRPISERYYSFAGEFSVTGAAEVDVRLPPEGWGLVEDNYEEDTWDDDED